MSDRIITSLEQNEWLDDWGTTIQPLVTKLVGRGRWRNLLTGKALGHPAHPAAVLLPLSCWLGSATLDLIGGTEGRDPSRRLLGAGVVTALPALATGASDWLDTNGAEKRVGTAHALANNTATVLYGVSWLLRRRGRHSLGVGCSIGATLLAGGAGFLGGHLAYHRGVGVNTTAFASGPTDWTEIRLAGAIERGAPVAAAAAGVALVAVGDSANGAVHVLEDRCTHRGAPLHEGTVQEGCITCPWHGSRFDLETGGVVEGPATVPQPVYEVETEGEKIRIRRPEHGGLRKNPVTANSLELG